MNGIDRWFLDNLYEPYQRSRSAISRIKALVTGLQDEDLVSCLPGPLLQELKQEGFGDRQIAELVNSAVGRDVADEDAVYHYRRRLAVHPVFQAIDTCGGELPMERRYLYSNYFASSAASLGEGASADPKSSLPGARKWSYSGAGPIASVRA